MDQTKFESEMMRARTMSKVENRPDYWAGYQRGLRRRYHGEKFGTAEEHQIYLAMADDPDSGRRERGQGYRDGMSADE